MARVSVSRVFADTQAWVSWESARALRSWYRFAGLAGSCAVVCLTVAAAAWMWQRDAERAAAELTLRLAQAPSTPAPPAVTSNGESERHAALRKRLKPATGVPDTVRTLIQLAEREGLVLPRGDYKSTQDVAGGFVRVRMALPVQGPPAAVQRFMLAALQAESALAIESVQFRKERLDSADMEARILWILYAEESGPGARSGTGGAS